MLKNNVVIELEEKVKDILRITINAEEMDDDFSIIRELAEQLMDEIETLED